MIAYGIYECYWYTKVTKLNCDSVDCVLTYRNETGYSVYEFPRYDIITVQKVKVDLDGELVDIEKHSGPRYKIGYTFILNFKYPVQPGSKMKTQLYNMFTRYHMGEKRVNDAIDTVV